MRSALHRIACRRTIQSYPPRIINNKEHQMKQWIWIALPAALISLTAAAQTKQQPAAKPKPATSARSGGLQASIDRGKLLYTQYCMSCHQADGGGVPRMNPPLIKTDYVLGNKTRLIKVLLLGLNENVEIDGEYYSNPMPAQANLKDQEIADVLTFVRNSFGNKASAVTAGEVKTVRAAVIKQ